MEFIQNKYLVLKKDINMLKLKKSFTLIETILSITGLSIIFVSVATLINFNLKETKKKETLLIFDQLVNNINKGINNNILKTIYDKYHLVQFQVENYTTNLEYKRIHDFKYYYNFNIVEPLIELEDINTFPQDGNNVNFIYNSTIKIQKDNLIEYNWKKQLFSLNDNILKNIKNYNILINQKKEFYERTTFPYLDIYVIDYSKLTNLNSFNRIVKTCLFKKNNDNNFYLSTLARSSDNDGFVFFNTNTIKGFDDDGSNSVNIYCNNVLKTFLIKNLDNELFNDIDTVDGNEEKMKKIINNNINFVKVSNRETILNKLKSSINKAKKIRDNLKTFNTIEENNNGLNKLLVDNYITCWDPSNNTCSISTDSSKEINLDLVKVIEPTNTDENGIAFDNKKINEMENIILTINRKSGLTETSDIKNNTSNNTANANDYIDNIYFYLDGSTTKSNIKVEGFVPILKFSTKLYDFKSSANLEPNMAFLTKNYELFSGTNKNNVVEDFIQTPFYFTNINDSKLKIKNSDNSLFSGDIIKYFNLNVPEIYGSLNSKKVGPFSSGILILFPWLKALNTNDELLYENFGYYYLPIN
jgi:hypothetical protein